MWDEWSSPGELIHPGGFAKYFDHHEQATHVPSGARAGVADYRTRAEKRSTS
jgi:hypothetical protein